MDDPLNEVLMEAFRTAAKKYFGQLADACGSKLEQVSPAIFGFSTEHAVVTIGVYPGHFPAVVSKIRRKESHDRVAVDNKRDVGANRVEQFITGYSPKGIFEDGQAWTAVRLETAVRQESEIFSRSLMSYLTTAEGDWKGLHAWLDKMIEEDLKENAYLLEFSRGKNWRGQRGSNPQPPP